MRAVAVLFALASSFALAVPEEHRTVVNDLEIPLHCEASYDAGVVLFGETAQEPPAKAHAAWDRRIQTETDESCQVMVSQGLLDASASLARQIAVQYWLDAGQARREQKPAWFLATLKKEAQAELTKFGLDAELFEEGGEYALDGERHRRELPLMIAYWKNAALKSGRAQRYYRFLFTPGGLQDWGYTLQDFARDAQGRMLYDEKHEPRMVAGSYSRAVLRIVEYARGALAQYHRDRPTFLQRVFDVNSSFYAGSWAWDRPEKLARELREEGYPKQMEAYLRMAEGLDLPREDRQVFFDMYQALLHAQNENLAADDHALEKVEQFAVDIAEFGVAILTGGESLALMYPKLGVQTAQTALLLSTVAAELLGSQAIAHYRAREIRDVTSHDVDWATYFDLSVEAALDFLPIASALPSVVVGVTQLGQLAFVSGPRLLSSLGKLSLRETLQLPSLRALPKQLWLNWWENKAVLMAGPKVYLMYSGMQVMHTYVEGGDRAQMATSLTYSALGLFLSPLLVNGQSLRSRFALNAMIVSISSVLAQLAVKREVDFNRTAVDVGYSAGFSFWTFEGNRYSLKQFERRGIDVKRQELVWVSLQYLKALNIDNHMKDLMLGWYGKNGVGAAASVRSYLKDTYQLDFSHIPDEDIDAGAKMFLQYEGIPADTGIIDELGRARAPQGNPL